MSSSASPSPSPSPVPPTQSQSAAIWWILGILGGGVVILALCGLLFAAYIARQVHIIEAGKNVEISTPVGQIQVNKAGPHDTGLPVYPGAGTLESNGANVRITPAEGTQVGIVAAKYFTSDPLDKVAAWYSQHLGPEFTRQTGRGAFRTPRIDASDADAAFVSQDGDRVRVVALKRKSGGVEIDLARVGQQEAQ